jgi:hypothetical protein
LEFMSGMQISESGGPCKYLAINDPDNYKVAPA